MDDNKGKSKTGERGLVAELEATLDACVDLFGDTWFTVGMYCVGRQGADAEDCVDAFRSLHACGCLRKPVNDGGQEYYQVMPFVVYPKKAIGAARN